MRYCIISCILFIGIGAVTVFTDPYFHYHKPFTSHFFYELPANNERYINDGITKHFDYDAVLTGTSMTENFKTSDFDAIFGCHSIKVPFSGGTFFEINNNQKVAFKNHSIKYMIRALDYSHIRDDKNALRKDSVYPFYLYNDTIWDDTKYLWNFDVTLQIFRNLNHTIKGNRGVTSFDEYANWNAAYTFGKKAVLEALKLYHTDPCTNGDTERARENIQQNVIDLASAHPETQFYYFFPPYSIAWWARLYEEGELEQQLFIEQIAIEMIVPCKNIHLFSFNTKFNWITNLDNYKDTLHYGEWINSEMLRLMKNDEYRITKENKEAYLQAEREFYTNFDYNSIFAE